MPGRPRSHTFDLQNHHDMVGKLGRELGRMHASTHDRQAVTDHAVNCALTAWHLVDWVWAEMKGDADLRAGVLAAIGCRPQDLDRDGFSAWCRQQCPELVVCQVIATATKHSGCDPRVIAEAADVTVRVSVAPGAGPLGTAPGGTMPLGAIAPESYVAKIVRNDRAEPAAPLFERVAAFWAALVATVGDGD